MSVGNEVKARPYRSPVRDRRSRQTRARIREAAARLFVARGYAVTSVADIARVAGVAPRTIYLCFPSKRVLLDEVIGTALTGDDAELPVREREWFREVLAAPASEVARLFAKHTTLLHQRSAALLEAADAAAGADPDVAARRDQGRLNRRADMHRIAAALAARSEVDAAYATDILYTLGSSGVYAMLVFQNGWTPERFEAWLAAMLESAFSWTPHS